MLIANPVVTTTYTVTGTSTYGCSKTATETIPVNNCLTLPDEPVDTIRIITSDINLPAIVVEDKFIVKA